MNNITGAKGAVRGGRGRVGLPDDMAWLGEDGFWKVRERKRVGDGDPVRGEGGGRGSKEQGQTRGGGGRGGKEQRGV